MFFLLGFCFCVIRWQWGRDCGRTIRRRGREKKRASSPFKVGSEFLRRAGFQMWTVRKPTRGSGETGAAWLRTETFFSIKDERVRVRCVFRVKPHFWFLCLFSPRLLESLPCERWGEDAGREHERRRGNTHLTKGDARASEPSPQSNVN